MGCLEGEAKRNIKLILELWKLCDLVCSETDEWLCGLREPPYIEPDEVPEVVQLIRALRVLVDRFELDAEGESNE